MRAYRKTIIATAVAASLAILTACSPAADDKDYEQKFKSNVVAQATMDQSNIEKDVAHRLAGELRAADPRIHSVDPIIVNGQRSIEISRSREDGSYEVWKMDPEKYAAMIKEAEGKIEGSPRLAQTKDEGSSAFTSSLGGALTGALIGSIAGNLIGNMFNSNQGVTRGFSNYSQYSQHSSDQRRGYTSALSSATTARYDRERERERRGGGAYVSPFIGSTAANYSNRTGTAVTPYRGVGYGAPSATQARANASAAAARSSASGTAFSSGARGSVSSGG